MKNKQINKFLFMFVVGVSLLFNFSIAEIVANTDYMYNSLTSSSSQRSTTSTSTVITGYTVSDVRNIILNYYSDSSNNEYISKYKTLLNDIISSGNDYVVYLPTDLTYPLIYTFPQNDNFNFCSINTGNSYLMGGFYNQAVNGDNSTYFRMRAYNYLNGSSRYYYQQSFSGDYNILSLNSFPCSEIIDSSVDILNIIPNGSTAYWNGTYFYQVEPDVETPEFVTDLTDDEIASVVSNFTNSIHWQNRDSAYNQFFIQHEEETGGKYMIILVSDYMYEWLSGLYIPAEVSSVDYETMNYDTYSILFNDGVSGTFFPWQTDRFNYKLYYSLDGVNFDYLRDMDCKVFKEYRWSMDFPVIYSNFYLPFKTLLGNTTNDYGVIVNDYSEEVDLKFSELVDSETGENYVFEGLEVKSNEETNPIIAKLSQFFKEMLEGFSGLFQVLIDQIFNFSDFLLETYGENVVTLVFAILIKSVTVLVSSIALIFRAVGFILSLVAIPASSALFSVDVAVNSTGLSFVGLNWGAKFIEGLNMLKAFSWNGLGLWTLFESFVSALEIIFFVKIVRKHYNHTL